MRINFRDVDWLKVSVATLIVIGAVAMVAAIGFAGAFFGSNAQ